MIRSEKTHQIKNIMQTGKAQGMHTLEMNIRECLAKGLIEPAAAKIYLAGVSSDASI